MKSLLLALVGITIYAFSGVVIEQRLEKFSTAALVLLFSAPVMVISLIWLLVERSQGTPISFPKGSLLLLAVVLGVLYYFGDSFYLGAFTSGGNVLTISTIAIMAPVLTAIIKNIWVGGWPNAFQLGGYAFAAVAVLLLAKGSVAS